ncbi:MAG TPA: hypothetical protein VFN95_14605, partial [Flavitalea sp.]|nr:hypothetical protein [Flavitalea sp.]
KISTAIILTNSLIARNVSFIRRRFVLHEIDGSKVTRLYGRMYEMSANIKKYTGQTDMFVQNVQKRLHTVVAIDLLLFQEICVYDL